MIRKTGFTSTSRSTARRTLSSPPKSARLPRHPWPTSEGRSSSTDKLTNVLVDNICLKVHRISEQPHTQSPNIVGMRDHPDAKTFCAHRRDRQADSVHRD